MVDFVFRCIGNLLSASLSGGCMAHNTSGYRYCRKMGTVAVANATKHVGLMQLITAKVLVCASPVVDDAAVHTLVSYANIKPNCC